MTIKEWNISKEEGESLILNIFKEIFRIKNFEVSENFLCKSMSKFANYNKIKLKKSNKVRNLNTFMKNIYGGLYKFLDKFPDIFYYEKENSKIFMYVENDNSVYSNYYTSDI